MSELYLLRHAKAVPQDEDANDIERRLDERGREGARAIAQWLKRQKIAPDLILCSPSTRTRETLDLIADAFRRAPEVAYENALYLAGADRLLARLRDIPAAMERVMLIGHNPGLHELAQSLADTGGGPLASRLAGNLPTAGLTRFEVATGWPGLRRRGARLVAMVSPRDLLSRD